MSVRYLTTFLLLAIFVLSACGNKETGSKEVEKTPKQAEQKEVKNESIEPTEDENGNLVFSEAGQKGKIDGGVLELKKIKMVNEVINISPLKVTLKDLKLFKMTEITDETRERMSQYTEETIKDQYIYLQVQYTVENTEEKNIQWNGLSNIVTDKGQQIDTVMKDFIITDADTEVSFLGKVKKDFADGYILRDEDVSKIKIIWGASNDADDFSEITKKQQVEYSF